MDTMSTGLVRRMPAIRLIPSRITPASGIVEDPPPATELISGDGELCEKGLEDFIKLHKCGVSVSYAVVAIMGPQSSGKSTLLNHLFNTNFTEMVASSGRSQTTKGIWIAKARKMDPFTMVMDVEGTDAEERGEDDTTFEKQSTLFALAVADIVLINMWCHDIGRENAANRPLLKTIFEVMMRLFPSTSPRKTTLHFVIRDKTTSPIQTLETKLRTDVQKIWEIVPKTEDLKNTPLTQYFNVEVDALSHYEYRREQFKKEVVHLRKQILRVAGDKRGVVPISGFPLHVKKLWETIKQNKDLNLPTHKKMVATVRCEEIAMEKLMLFESDKEWVDLVAAAKIELVSGFSRKTSSILNRYLSEYDSESEYFEEGVRNAKRQYLESQAFELAYPAYINTLDHLRTEVLQKFETRLDEVYAVSVRTCQRSCEVEFDQRCSDAAIEQAKWDASTVREELVRDIQNHALHVRTDKLPQVVEQCRSRLAAKVTKHLNRIFSTRNEEDIAWASIREILKREIDSAASAFRSDVAAFELEQATLEQKVDDLKQCATKLVENKFKEETDTVLDHMKERFFVSTGIYREPLPMHKIEEVFRKCLKLLSTMAVIRLDESSSDDEVESVLVSAFIGGDEVAGVDDPLASYTWEKVPPEMTLITPVGCNDIWVQFKKDIEPKLNQTKLADEVKHALHVRTDKLPQVVKQYRVTRARLGATVTKHLNHLFSQHNEERIITWASIRSFLKREIHSAASAFRSDVAAFELEQATLEQKVDNLKQYARELVENKFKEETGNVLHLMEERFILSMWKNEEPFRKCLKLLSTMAVIRLDESYDEVESVLVSVLIGGVGVQVARDDDPLASYTWEKVPPEMTLITPVGCNDIWVQFKKDIEPKLNQKKLADEEKKSKSLPYYWMRVAMWVLGVGEFVSRWS